MIKVTGHRLIVKAEVETKTESGIIVAVDERKERAHSVVGIVIDIGDSAWQGFNCEPWCKVGDKIIFAKYAGRSVTDPSDPDGEYIILNDDDVLCVVK